MQIPRNRIRLLSRGVRQATAWRPRPLPIACLALAAVVVFDVHVPALQEAAVPTRPVGTMSDLMVKMIYPTSDAIFYIETRTPKTDAEWGELQAKTLTLAESANLLMMPGRHVARPGEKSDTPGVELEPPEMEALITKDLGAWRKRAHGLHEAGVAALQAIDAKDANKLFEVGEQIERACEGCHSQYWYPNEKIPPVPTSGAQ